MPITVDELRAMLRSGEEIADEIPGYGSVSPYKNGPIRGGVSYLFLKRFKERHLTGQDWIPTQAIHDIYYSTHGSHMNALIKLAKSKFVETKIVNINIDVETADGFFPQRTNTRVWRLTKKGLRYLEGRDLPFEDLVKQAKERATNYLKKKGIGYEISYPYDGHGVIAFQGRDWNEGSQRKEFRLKDFAERPSHWQDLYNAVSWLKWEKDSPEEDAKFADARKWLAERPEIKTSVVTLIGTVSVDGDVNRSTMMLNDKRICVVPSLPVHHSDIYICRLSWLNYDLDNLIKLIVREHIMVECPSCHSVAKYGGIFHAGWIFCPICGAPIDEMVEDYILRRKR